MAQTKVGIIAGYGQGISAAVARRFGSKNFKLALFARTQSRLDEAVSELAHLGITAKGYATDLSDPAAVKAAVASVHKDLGPISLLHWNAFSTGSGVSGFTNAPPEQFTKGFDVSVTGLVAAVQAAYDDLKANQGSVLVTGGGLGLENDTMAQLAVEYDAISLSVAKAAQRKFVHVLHKALSGDGIYVGEVTVLGMVSSGVQDPGAKAGLTADMVADKFCELFEKRDPAVWFTTTGPG